MIHSGEKECQDSVGSGHLTNLITLDMIRMVVSWKCNLVQNNDRLGSNTLYPVTVLALELNTSRVLKVIHKPY